MDSIHFSQKQMSSASPTVYFLVEQQSGFNLGRRTMNFFKQIMIQQAGNEENVKALHDDIEIVKPWMDKTFSMKINLNELLTEKQMDGYFRPLIWTDGPFDYIDQRDKMLFAKIYAPTIKELMQNKHKLEPYFSTNDSTFPAATHVARLGLTAPVFMQANGNEHELKKLSDHIDTMILMGIDLHDPYTDVEDFREISETFPNLKDSEVKMYTGKFRYTQILESLKEGAYGRLVAKFLKNQNLWTNKLQRLTTANLASKVVEEEAEDGPIQ